MADGMQIKVRPTIQSAIKTAPEAFDQNTLSHSLFVGAKVLARAVRAAAPRDSGFLKSGIIPWTTANKGSFSLEGLVTIAKYRLTNIASSPRRKRSARAQASINKWGPFYGKFIESGTTTRFKESAAAKRIMTASGGRRKGVAMANAAHPGRSTGKVTAKPFFAPAFAAYQSQATEAVANDLRESLKKWATANSMRMS